MNNSNSEIFPNHMCVDICGANICIIRCCPYLGVDVLQSVMGLIVLVVTMVMSCWSNHGDIMSTGVATSLSDYNNCWKYFSKGCVTVTMVIYHSLRLGHF